MPTTKNVVATNTYQLTKEDMVLILLTNNYTLHSPKHIIIDYRSRVFHNYDQMRDVVITVILNGAGRIMHF